MIQTLPALMLLALVAASLAAQQPSLTRAVQLGPRPFFLIDDMDAGPLKDTLRLPLLEVVLLDVHREIIFVDRNSLDSPASRVYK